MGWYATGAEATDADMAIQRKVGRAGGLGLERGAASGRGWPAEACRGSAEACRRADRAQACSLRPQSPARLTGVGESPVFGAAAHLDPPLPACCTPAAHGGQRVAGLPGCYSQDAARAQSLMPCASAFPASPAQLMEVNESPVFLRLDPTQSPGQKDLPVWLYESGAPGAGQGRLGWAVVGMAARAAVAAKPAATRACAHPALRASCAPRPQGCTHWTAYLPSVCLPPCLRLTSPPPALLREQSCTCWTACPPSSLCPPSTRWRWADRQGAGRAQEGGRAAWPRPCQPA